MKNKIIRAIRDPLTQPTIWAIGGYGLSSVIRFSSNLVLTRLLAPEIFGLMAIVNVMMTGINMMSDVGINTVLVQSKRGEDREFINTAWTIKVLRGLFLFFIVIIISYPVSIFFEDVRLINITIAMSAVVLLNGFVSNSLDLANRNLMLKKLTIFNLFGQFIASSSIVLWAYYSPDVWAFVFGNILVSVYLAIFSHFLFPTWSVQFGWNKKFAYEIIHFGKWIFLTSILVFVATQIDRITLAKLLPLETVGLYSIAFLWAALPLNAAQTFIGRVMFPHASNHLRSGLSDTQQLLKYRRLSIFCFFSVIGVLGGSFDVAFRSVYLENYWGAVNFFYILLIGNSVKCLEEFYRVYNLASGRPMFTTLGSAVAIGVFIVTVLPLYSNYEAEGIAIAYSLSHVGSLMVSMFGVWRLELIDVKGDAIAVVSGVVFFVLVFGMLGLFA